MARLNIDRDHRPLLPAIPPSVGSRVTAVRGAALELFAAKSYRATTMDEIGARAGIRGPSVYKHVTSKQQLLADVMIGTMDSLLAVQKAAVATSDDVATQLRRMTEAHVRYHARHRLEAFVGNREISSLEEPHRGEVLERRRRYEQGFREVIQAGVDAGVFALASARLGSYAILDMGMGVAAWFRGEGELSEDAVAFHYGDMALRLVGHRHVS